MSEDNPYSVCQICGAPVKQIDIFVMQVAIMSRLGDLEDHQSRRIQLCLSCKKRLWTELKEAIEYVETYAD